MRKESELIELIEDFHTQYQFVYHLYDHLRGQLSQTVNGTKEDEGYLTASSSSDSDSDLENDVSNKDTRPKNRFHKHQLKEKLNQLAQDKESFNSEYMEAEKMQKNLEEECEELREKLGEKEKEISSLARIHELLIKELESELSSLNLQLDSMCVQKRVLEELTENKLLQDQVFNLENIEKEMEKEHSALVQNGLVSEDFIIKGLIAQVNNLKLNVNCLNSHKDDDEQMAHGTLHEKLTDQMNKMKRDFEKKAEENSDFLSQMETLKKELESKSLDLQKMQKAEEDSQVRTKRLESEIQRLCNQKTEIENQMERKYHENSQLKQEMEGLQGKMAKIENTLKERKDECSSLQKELENEDKDKSAQIVALMTQTNHLDKELESKNELERQIEIKNRDIDKLTEEKELLHGRILELEKKLEDRGDEFSGLQNEMSKQIAALTKEISQLQQETDMKFKLDEQISCQEKEISQLGEERESLLAKIMELEIALTEKEDNIIDLQRKLQIGENEKSSLSAQISYLQGEVSDQKQQSQERLTQMENHNSELISKVADQQVILKQQEDTLNKLREDSKQVKSRFLQAADRKMDEVAQEFRKNFEDKLRILSQRVRVSEQFHVENKDNWKRYKQRCEQQHPELERKLSELMSSSKADLWKISEQVNEMMKGMENVVSKMESKEKDFLQRIFMVSDEIQVAKNWVRWTMDEMKPWKNEPGGGSPFAPPGDEREQDKVMKEKVKRLEAKLNKEKSDKLRLMKVGYELQKKVAELEKVVVEKDEGLLRLGKEKVEAIRQLCMWIDYHQYRFDQLKEMILVKRIKSRGKA